MGGWNSGIESGKMGSEMGGLVATENIRLSGEQGRMLG